MEEFSFIFMKIYHHYILLSNNEEFILYLLIDKQQ